MVLSLFDRFVTVTEGSEWQHVLRALRPFVEDGRLPNMLLFLILVPLLCAVVGKTKRRGGKPKSQMVAANYSMGVVHSIQLYGSLSTICFLRWTLRQSPFRFGAVVDYIAYLHTPDAVPFTAVVLAPVLCHIVYKALSSPFLCASCLRHVNDGYSAASMTCWIAIEIFCIAPAKTRIVTLGWDADESTARDEVANFCALTGCKLFLNASAIFINLYVANLKKTGHSLKQRRITFNDDSVELNIYCSDTLHQAPERATYQVYAGCDERKGVSRD